MLLAVLLAVAPASAGTTPLPPYGDPQLLGRLALPEVSGLAAHPDGDALLVHEDSATGAEVHRLDRAGRVAATYALPVPNRDWEDLALAPDRRGRPSLWLADIGDNEAAREQVQVHRVPLPAPDAPGGELDDVTTYEFRYEDGPHDAEALLVLPGGERVAVVTKSLGATGVYVAPLDPSRPQVLRRVADLALEPTGTAGGPVGGFGQVLVTGGAISPDGERVALRTYTDLHEWRMADDLASTFTQPPTRTPLPPTEQGEAVAYDADGQAVLVASEGEMAPLHRLTRQAGPTDQAPGKGPTPPAEPAPGGAVGGQPGRPVPSDVERALAALPAVAAALAGAALLALLVLRGRRRG